MTASWVSTNVLQPRLLYIEKEQINGFEAKSFHLKPMEERHQHKKTNLYDYSIKNIYFFQLTALAFDLLAFVKQMILQLAHSKRCSLLICNVN